MSFSDEQLKQIDGIFQNHQRAHSKDSSVLERHAQTILISLITAALLFAASFVYSSNEKVSLLSTQLQYATESIKKLEIKIDNLSYNNVERKEVQDLEVRIRNLEKQSHRHGLN